MKTTRIPTTLPIFLACLACGLPSILPAQTLVTHDATGDRSAEVSNQPVTAPVITGQPQALLGQVSGTYTFSVVATGANLTYQWFKDSTAISGATYDTLTISNAQSTDFSTYSVTTGTSTGVYSVVVTNSAGSVTSNAAALYLDSQSVGLPDWWQQEYFGTVVGNYAGASPSNNGITNLEAYTYGLNPNAGASEGYTLTTTGPVTVQPSQPIYAPGTVVTLSLPSGQGFFQSWSGDATGTANPLTVTMNSNKTISAVAYDYANTRFGATLASNEPGYVSVTALLAQA
jgi:hypothetical protein